MKIKYFYFVKFPTKMSITCGLNNLNEDFEDSRQESDLLKL